MTGTALSLRRVDQLPCRTGGRTAAEHLTGVSIKASGDNACRRAFIPPERPLEKVAFSTMLTMNWVLSIINENNPM